MIDLVLHPRGKSIPGTYRSTERKESVSWWLLKKKKKKRIPLRFENESSICSGM